MFVSFHRISQLHCIILHLLEDASFWVVAACVVGLLLSLCPCVQYRLLNCNWIRDTLTKFKFGDNIPRGMCCVIYIYRLSDSGCG